MANTEENTGRYRGPNNIQSIREENSGWLLNQDEERMKEESEVKEGRRNINAINNL